MKELLESYTSQLGVLVDRPCQIVVRSGETELPVDVTVRGVKKAVLTQMLNAPAKRLDSEKEKWYTPQCLVLECDEGSLYFVVEDIQKVVTTLSGVRVVFAGYSVEATCW